MSRIKAEAVRIVESHGGSVNQFVGDEVLALFGIPTAHKDDTVRAVRAAQELHEMVRQISPELELRLGRRIRLHSGICTGLIVTDFVDDRDGRVGITGDTVNTGARLKALAAEDAILVGPETSRAVKDYFELRALDSVSLKGKEAAVTPYEVVRGAVEASTSARRPFVGRQTELKQIETAVAACLEARAGQVIVIRGDPGIGKTRLAVEAWRLGQDRGFLCHGAEVVDFGAGLGQDPVRALLRGLLGIEAGASAKALSDAARSAVAAGRIEAKQETFLVDLLGLSQPEHSRATYDAMSNEYRNSRKRETVCDLLRNCATSKPRLLLVEDVHWANGLILTYLAELAAATADCPALLVLSTRVAGDPLDLAWRQSIGSAAIATIDLTPLRRADALALAQSFRDVTAQITEHCIERASGNPLFLEQLLLNAEESAESALPGSVQSIVLARVDHLALGDKAALQVAAVLGQRFDPDAVRYMMGASDYDFGHLTRQALIRRDRTGYLFVHALIHDGVYESILHGVRRELHARAARWYRERDLAIHAEHLERASDPGAAHAYLEAAEAETAQLHFEHALALAERGLKLATDGQLKFELMQHRGRLLLDLGSIESSLQAYRAASELAIDDAQRCRALVGIAAVLRLSDRYDDALQVLEDARHLALAQEANRELAEIHHLRGNIAFLRGDIKLCLDSHGQALELARRAGSAEAEARSLGGLGDGFYVQGRIATAFEQFQRCVALCQAHGFRRIEVEYNSMAAAMRLFMNDAGGALAGEEEALRMAQEVGHLRAQLIAHRCLAVTLLELGEFARARHDADSCGALARLLKSRSMEAGALAHSAMTHLAEGSVQTGWPILQQALEMSRDTGMGLDGPWILGSVALYTDRPEQRDAALEEGKRLLRKGSVSHNHLFFYRLAIAASLKCNEWEKARAFAADLEDYTHPEAVPFADLIIACGRALADFGQRGEDCELMLRLEALRAKATAAGLMGLVRHIDEALARRQA